MILFRNKGLIDLVAAVTFGVNAKESGGAIGMFGTGLKYAVANVLRNGGRIVMHRGLDRHEFRLRDTEIRGKEFRIVELLNPGEAPQALGFTTHLGAHWEPWQVYRELYCNALDEGGDVAQVGTEHCAEGATYITVSNWPAFEEVHAIRNTIVLPESEPRAISQGVEIHRQSGQQNNRLYYRRVRAGETSKPATYCYNILLGQQLTEDRTFRWAYQPLVAIANAIVSLRDAAFIEELLTQPVDSFEGVLDYSGVSVDPSEEFLDTVARLRNDFSRPLNPTALRVLLDRRATAWALEDCELSPHEADQLLTAEQLLYEMGYRFSSAIKVQVVRTLGASTLGMALRTEGRILISKRCFEVGTKCVAGTLLEEHLHMEHGYDDCTRDLQNYLLDRLMHLASVHYLGRAL